MKPRSQRKGNAEDRYWDSTVFLAWLLPEKTRVEDCRSVLDAAQQGKVRIVTSAITLAEVIHLKDHPPLLQDQQRKIDEFFKRQFILIRPCDRFLGTEARELIWRHGVHPKDEIHLATAIKARLRIFETHDDNLLSLTGKLPIPGGTPLTIRKPHFAETLALFPGQKTTKKKQRG